MVLSYSPSTPKLVNFHHFWIPGVEKKQFYIYIYKYIYILKNIYIYKYIYIYISMCILHDFAIFRG